MTTPPVVPIGNESVFAPPVPEPENSEGYRLPPGLPLPLFFYAHKRWVKLGEPIRLFEHLRKTFGAIAHYRFLGTIIVFVNDPVYIRELLINQAPSFVKERTLQRMKILLGEGLITSDEPLHLQQRRIAAPAFHRQRIAGYGDQIVAITRSHAHAWKAGQVVDVNDAMMVLSLEIIARTLFDTQITDDIRSVNDETNTIMGLYNFLVAFPAIERVLHLPIPGIVRFRRSKARLDATVNRMIAERRRELASSVEERGDLLSILLEAKLEAVDGSGDPIGMSDRQIRDEVLTIFLAGYETVANALTWTWYLLSQHPEIAARLQDEVRTVLGTGPSARAATTADLPALRYAEQVFSEAMRLYPPAWAMGRMSTKPVRLGEYTIPPGAHFFTSQYVMHRSEEYFPDPLRFDPDRFLPSQKAARDKFTYFPFGGGARQCIGESFAWMEGILVLATIAQQWRMSFAGTHAPVPKAKITLRPDGPVLMRLSPA